MNGIGSFDLVLTSPPYPMIQMWDELFAQLSAPINRALQTLQAETAFELMHAELDRVWENAFRALRPGGFLVVNVGDATRTIGKSFALYSNHARVVQACRNVGFRTLPNILWRKQTNAPNKFMGSGMLPAGAYVTLEHEYVLIFRKGGTRAFKTPPEKLARMQSAIFWEERNRWYSDIWQDIKGVRQAVLADGSRTRSAAFPFELAYRLVNMFSVQGDWILDPFVGTGTTMAAAMASGRNSAGIEIDRGLFETIADSLENAREVAEETSHRRLGAHSDFALERQRLGLPLKYRNEFYSFPVMTRQETRLMLPEMSHVSRAGQELFRAEYRTPEETHAVSNKKGAPLPSVHVHHE